MPPKPAPTPADPGPSPLRPPGSGQRLRAVPGRYDIGRLPLLVAPVDGEHVASWLTRWAHRYGLSAGQLLTELGAAAPAAPMARIEKHLRAYQPAIAAAAGLAELPTGIDVDCPAWDLGPQLARYMAGYHGLYRPPVSRTRFCPACLAESVGAWRGRWTLPLQLVCPRHEVLLVRCCPDCRQQRFASPAWMTSISPAWVCAEPIRDGHIHRMRYPTCGRDLRTVPAVAVTADEAALQARLWRLAGREHAEHGAAGVAVDRGVVQNLGDGPVSVAHGQRIVGD